MKTTREKWHSLTYKKSTGCWVLSEGSYYRGRHLKWFYTQDFKSPKQAASEVILKVRQFLGGGLVKLKIYSPMYTTCNDYKLVKTISFIGASNESTL